MAATSPDDRVTALEELVAHQERTIQDLNETVLAQWQAIERLQTQLSKLAGEVDGLAADEEIERTPPHASSG